MGAMQLDTYPKSDELRDLVLLRAERVAKAKGVSLRSLGLSILNDGDLFPGIIRGRSMTLKTYERVMAWFDANWPAESGA